MKALILAAGYATRLHPLTFNTPKSLLKIKGKAILDYIVEKIERTGMIKETFIISNDKFYPQFEDWLMTKTNGVLNGMRLINDRSTSAENRRGAILDIDIAIEHGKLNDDLLIIAGDNLFDFDLGQFIEFSLENKPYHSICLYQDNHNDLTRFGIAQLNGDSQIVAFEEKPAQPKSNLIGTCIYFFPREKLHLIANYLIAGHQTDTPGSYMSWLTQHDKVYGKVFNGLWFDLGDFDALSHALINFKHQGEGTVPAEGRTPAYPIRPGASA